MSSTPAPIKCSDLVFDIDFHPKLNLICGGLYNGNLLLYKLNKDKTKFKKKWNISAHKKTITNVSFSPNGKQILAASSDQTCSVTDLTTENIIWQNKYHDKSYISSILYTSLNTFLTTTDDGMIRHWDIRNEQQTKPIHEIKPFDDTITSINLNEQQYSFVCTSGGYLGLFDILNKKKISCTNLSEEYKTEFTSSQIISYNSSIVCSTINGYINTFATKPWALLKQKTKASTDIINTLLKFNEYTILFGTTDGVIKTFNSISNKVGDVIAKHPKNDSIEKIIINKNKYILASISHDRCIQFYPVTIKDSKLTYKTKKKKSFFRDL
ncbi:nucleolar Jumonji domain interacting protein, putative [Hepatocystis sp. ex Piliocolobus tephrosceles]|nr:nucleolar Jumonji domain interacting protein, putative [Hepatocystis sp. ex Piliocolobus tephrosceles]